LRVSGNLEQGAADVRLLGAVFALFVDRQPGFARIPRQLLGAEQRGEMPGNAVQS
jgi:hypothetical protein